MLNLQKNVSINSLFRSHVGRLTQRTSWYEVDKETQGHCEQDQSVELLPKILRERCLTELSETIFAQILGHSGKTVCACSRRNLLSYNTKLLWTQYSCTLMCILQTSFVTDILRWLQEKFGRSNKRLNKQVHLEIKRLNTFLHASS